MSLARADDARFFALALLPPRAAGQALPGGSHGGAALHAAAAAILAATAATPAACGVTGLRMNGLDASQLQRTTTPPPPPTLAPTRPSKLATLSESAFEPMRDARAPSSSARLRGAREPPYQSVVDALGNASAAPSSTCRVGVAGVGSRENWADDAAATLGATTTTAHAGARSGSAESV